MIVPIQILQAITNLAPAHFFANNLSSVITGEYHFMVVYIVQWQEATIFLQIFPTVQDPCLLGPGEAV
jgi:hypothetical protein